MTSSAIPLLRGGQAEQSAAVQTDDEVHGLPWKAKLLSELAGLGMQVPEAVCLELPLSCGNRESWRGATAVLIHEGLQRIDAAVQPRRGGIRIAVRPTTRPGTLCVPSLLNVKVAPAEDVKLREEAVSEILGWAERASLDILRREHSSLLFRPLLQRMVGPAPGEGWGWVQTRGLCEEALAGWVVLWGSTGTVDEVLSVAQWDEMNPGQGRVLRQWARQLKSAVAGPWQLQIATERDKLFLLSIRRGKLVRFDARKLIRHVVDGDTKQSEILAVGLTPELITGGHSTLTAVERRALSSLAHGASTGRGVATGRLALSSESIRAFGRAGDPVVWVKEEFFPSDVGDFQDAAVGLVSRTGGPASHVVVLARGLGLVAVPGAAGLIIERNDRCLLSSGMRVAEGEWITLEESSGSIFHGRLDAARRHGLDSALLRQLAEQTRLKVMVNAELRPAAQAGFASGAVGIGLCRSENHLGEPSVRDQFAEYLAASRGGGYPELPSGVRAALHDHLVELLRGADGRVVHYRLLDPDLRDFLGPDAAADQVADSTLADRGTRWGLRSGFYGEQIRVIEQAVEAVATPKASVSICIVAPLVSTVGEVLEVRRLIASSQDRFRAMPGVKLHLGCMIETPRAALLARHLAHIVDVFCIGTNDLTQATWVWSRNSSDLSLRHALAHGLVESSPFTQIDSSGVIPLLERAVRDARSQRPDIKVVVCGEHAGDWKSIRQLAGIDIDCVSCSPANVPTCVVAVWQLDVARRMGAGPGELWDVPTNGRTAELTRAYVERVRSARSIGRNEYAMQLASEWAVGISGKLGDVQTGNWKFFKRDVVAYFFSGREHRRFLPGWRTSDVLEYALSLDQAGETIRYSIFPDDIACHSVSKVLDPVGGRTNWEVEINELDHELALEVFPQQRDDQLCFRAVMSDGRMDVEAGRGQAMYVFEKERGRHPVARGYVEIGSDSLPLRGVVVPGDEGEELLQDQLRDLLAERGSWLLRRLVVVADALGLEWVGVEGYWDSDARGEPFVCDIDLPLDLAFHS